MKTYESMKSSNVLWLGDIPKHWELRFLEQTCHEKSVKNIGNIESNVLSLSYGYIIKKKNVYSGLVANDFSTYQIVQNGDIILRFTDLQNDHKSLRTGLVTQTGIITSAYTCITPTINSAYLRYLLHSYDLRKVFYGMGGGVRQSIGFKDVRHMFVPVPPRDEQDQIVRFLDWKVSEINRLINIKQKEIYVLEEGVALKLKNELSKIPNSRDIPLKRVFLVPMSDGPHETPEFVDEGIPFISAEASHDGKIYLNECRGYITKESHELYCMKVKPQRDDIFIVKSGSTTGKTVIVDFDDEFSIWSPLALIRCNKLAIPRYIFYYCSSTMFQQQVRDNWSFGTQPNIGMSILKNLHILLPTIEEQEHIVNVLDEYWNTTLELKKNISKQIETLQELKTRLISDVVTGKIDVRSVEIPDYEYVEEESDEMMKGEIDDKEEEFDEE